MNSGIMSRWRSKQPSVLVRKIVTEDGQTLTPTHRVKNGVRYRYYANFKLAGKSRGTGSCKFKPTGNGIDVPIIRVPALAIERLVIDRLLELLRSQTELAEALQSLNLSAGQLCNALQTTNGVEQSGNGLRLIIKDTNQSQPNTHLAPLLVEAFMLREAPLNGPHDRIEAISKAL